MYMDMETEHKQPTPPVHGLNSRVVTVQAVAKDRNWFFKSARVRSPAYRHIGCSTVETISPVMYLAVLGVLVYLPTVNYPACAVSGSAACTRIPTYRKLSRQHYIW